MSQAGSFIKAGGSGGFLRSLTGNSGLPVFGNGAGNINIVGVGGVNVVDDPLTNTLTISVSSGSFTWQIVTSADNVVQIVAENGYSCQGVSIVLFLLPLAPVLGDTFIVASTTARFQIAANAGQAMRIGNAISTPGAGTATSNAAGDVVEFVYMGSNIFQSFAPLGGGITLT